MNKEIPRQMADAPWPNPDLSVHARTLRDLAKRQDGRLQPRITRCDLTQALLEVADHLAALGMPIMVTQRGDEEGAVVG